LENQVNLTQLNLLVTANGCFVMATEMVMLNFPEEVYFIHSHHVCSPHRRWWTSTATPTPCTSCSSPDSFMWVTVVVTGQDWDLWEILHAGVVLRQT